MSRTTKTATLALSGLLTGASVACSDGNTALSSGTPERKIGVLQLQLAARMESRGDTSRGDTAVSSGGVTWDRLPSSDVVTPPKVIELPDTIRARQPVEVVVRTVLPDGCWRTDGQDVQQAGSTVTVTPHDARSEAAACTEIFAYGEHRFTVTFDAPGAGTVRVNGRLLRRGGQATSDPITAERTVVVR